MVKLNRFVENTIKQTFKLIMLGLGVWLGTYLAQHIYWR